MRHSTLAIVSFFLFAKAAVAGDFWFYEWVNPPVPSQTIEAMSEGGDRENGNITSARAHDVVPSYRQGDKRWIVTGFEYEPYQGQVKALSSLPLANRISVLFSRPPSPVLAAEYLELARSWREHGISGQIKFVGSLPTALEAKIIKPVCELGVRVSFVSSYLPGQDEIENLNSLGECVKVDFSLGRYFRFEEIEILKRLKNVSLGLTNNYFPVTAHVNYLNLIGTPVDLRVVGAIPASDQLTTLGKTEKLTGLFLDMDAFASEEQYSVLEKIDRSIAQKLTMRWAFRAPRELELKAWAQIKPARLQIVAEALTTKGVEEKLRALSADQTEVIIETFSLTSRTFRPEF